MDAVTAATRRRTLLHLSIGPVLWRLCPDKDSFGLVCPSHDRSWDAIHFPAVSQPATYVVLGLCEAEFVLVVGVAVGAFLNRQPDLAALMFAVVATLSPLSPRKDMGEVRGRLNRRSPEAVRAAA